MDVDLHTILVGLRLHVPTLFTLTFLSFRGDHLTHVPIAQPFLPHQNTNSERHRGELRCCRVAQDRKSSLLPSKSDWKNSRNSDLVETFHASDLDPPADMIRSTTCSFPSRAARKMDTPVPLSGPGEDASDAARDEVPVQASSFRKFRELLMLKRFETHDNLPVLVQPRLFIGSLGAATNLQALQASQITHILCAASSLPLQFPQLFVYERLALADLPTVRLDDAIRAGINFINRALADGGTVLVHCFVGRSRSASIILAYLIAEHAMTLDAAMLLLKSVRPQVQPNSGFLSQLSRFERELAAKRELIPGNETPS